jgi:hypothetical protein
MENLKIRIPCEEVSKLVQEKAFEMGYKWFYANSSTNVKEAHFIFLYSDGDLTTLDGDYQSYFNLHYNKERSWQEFVYGAGEFRRWLFGNTSTLIYKVKGGWDWFWCESTQVCHLWHSYDDLESNTYLCDMFGNKLEENIMNFTKDDLVVGKHVVEYANDSKKYLYLGDKFVTLNNGFMWSKELTHNLTDRDLDESWDITKVYEVDLCKVTNLTDVFDHLVLVWKREKVLEMTMDEICLALGKSVKIIKGE